MELIINNKENKYLVEYKHQLIKVTKDDIIKLLDDDCDEEAIMEKYNKHRPYGESDFIR